jgi:hypothetical protein
LTPGLVDSNVCEPVQAISMMISSNSLEDILKPKVAVYFTSDRSVGAYNVLDLLLDEEVV